MTTVIIDTKSKEGKRLVDYLRTVKYDRVVEENRGDSPGYNTDFVNKIKEREKQASVKPDMDNLWK